MKIGDKTTFAGIYRKVDNPKWRWWKPWQPRRIGSKELQVFTLVSKRSSPGGYGGYGYHSTLWLPEENECGQA